MSKKSTGEEEYVNITYYFTVIFTAIGTVLVFYFLYQKVGRVDLFIILLSTSAGGIPIGFIGAFIDYKISVSKLEKNSFEQ